MTIEIQFQHMPESEALHGLTSAKLFKLLKKYGWIIRAQVLYKLEQDSAGKGKICEIELSAPGPRIFARSHDDDFEKALVSTLKELEKQLSKRKELFKRY